MDPTIPQPWRVNTIRRESRDTFTLKLEPMRNEARFSFAAGQFNMIYVFGVGEVPISMSGHDAQSACLLHTVRGVGAVSRAITRLKSGAVVGVRGPFGRGWPLAAAAGGDVIVMAGGIGMAPLRPALQAMLHQRSNYKRIALLYGARRPRELLYVKELRRWAERSDLRVELTVDVAGSDWKGDVGVVTALLAKIDFDAGHAIAMVCGPEIMMRFAVRELRQRGMAEGRVFLSMERNMKCAVGFCGHCQFGPSFICKDGPVFGYDRIKPWFETREI
jgi:NAD(P)H-flavin reductase